MQNDLKHKNLTKFYIFRKRFDGIIYIKAENCSDRLLLYVNAFIKNMANRPFSRKPTHNLC